MAASQRGNVTRAQLLKSLGLGGDAIDYRLRIGHLRLMFRGVYLVGPIAPSGAREMAAVLACGGGAVLSHFEARQPAGSFSPYPARDDAAGRHAPRSARSANAPAFVSTTCSRCRRTSRPASTASRSPPPHGRSSIQSPDGAHLLADMSEAERLGSWHLVGPDGEVTSAGAAAAPLARLLPGGRPLAALFDAFPGATERAYGWVADHRGAGSAGWSAARPARLGGAASVGGGRRAQARAGVSTRKRPPGGQLGSGCASGAWGPGAGLWAVGARGGQRRRSLSSLAGGASSVSGVWLDRPPDEIEQAGDRDLQDHREEEDRPELPPPVRQCIPRVTQLSNASTWASVRPTVGSVGTSRVGASGAWPPSPRRLGSMQSSTQASGRSPA